MSDWKFLAIAIAAEVVATSALKVSDGFSRLLPTTLVVIGYGCAFFALSLALRTIPLGPAYAIWSGIGILVLSLVGWLIFQQPLGAPQIIGIILIIAGVALVQSSA